MSWAGLQFEFIVLMQLTSFGFAAFGGAWLASGFDGVRMTPQSYTVATGAPVLLAWVVATLPLDPLSFLWTLVLVAALICLAMTDTKMRAVPDCIAIPAMGLGIVHAASIGAPFQWFACSAVGMLLIALGYATLTRGTRHWIGSGDMVMIAGALAWFGPGRLPDLAVIVLLVLCLQALIRRMPLPEPDACMPTKAHRRSRLTIAPALAAAQLAIWLGGPLF